MITTSDQLFCSGNHFTDALCTLGVGTMKHLPLMLLPPFSFFVFQSYFYNIKGCTTSCSPDALYYNSNGISVEHSILVLYYIWSDSTIKTTYLLLVPVIVWDTCL